MLTISNLGGNGLRLWPWGVLEKPFCQLCPAEIQTRTWLEKPFSSTRERELGVRNTEGFDLTGSRATSPFIKTSVEAKKGKQRN